MNEGLKELTSITITIFYGFRDINNLKKVNFVR